MMDHIEKSVALADKITTLVENGLAGLDRTIASWPAEFRAIIWDAVALTASHRSQHAKSKISEN